MILVHLIFQKMQRITKKSKFKACSFSKYIKPNLLFLEKSKYFLMTSDINLGESSTFCMSCKKEAMTSQTRAHSIQV